MISCTSGWRTTSRSVTAKDELSGACEGATHFVRSANVGAFAVASGTRGQLKTAGELFGLGASAASKSEKRSVRRDGDIQACEASSADAG